MEPNTNGNGFYMPVAPIGYGGYGMPYGNGYGGGLFGGNGDIWGLLFILAVCGGWGFGGFGDEMSGERGRSRSTGRFVSRDMDGMSRRMMRRRSGDSFEDSYDDGGDMETQLEDIANDKAMPRAKRDAARAMLAELRKGDM